MEIVWLSIGLILLMVVFADILMTTISMRGGGKLTLWIMDLIWKLFHLVSNQFGNKKYLSYASLTMISALILFWGLSAWLSVFIIFASHPGSVVEPMTGLAASLWNKLYFTGYIWTTMGLGDYEPGHPYWGVAASLFSFFGLVFITLIVSYILPIVSHTIEKKQFSIFIHHIGDSPEEFLMYFWNGKDFSDLKDMSHELQSNILLMSQSHLVYPILHYSHFNNKKEALEISICIIDEAMSILINHVEPDQWREKDVLPLKKSITTYLENICRAYGLKENDQIPAQKYDLSILSDANIKLRNVEERMDNRRGLLIELLKSHGWSWKDVYPQKIVKWEAE